MEFASSTLLSITAQPLLSSRLLQNAAFLKTFYYKVHQALSCSLDPLTYPIPGCFIFLVWVKAWLLLTIHLAYRCFIFAMKGQFMLTYRG